MIIVRLSGGLGNQMFQFAAAYACAKRLQTELVADPSLLNNTMTHNGYELNRVFGLNLREATLNDLKSVLGILAYGRVKKYFTNVALSRFRPKSLVLEPHFHYWPGFCDVTNNSYLQGYWQSEKYFHGFEAEIRELFQFKIPFDRGNEILKKQIHDHESVSLHVRRGDYVTNSNNAKIHDVDLTEYYNRSIEFVSQSISGPIFYVFTDDASWVRSKMKLPQNHILIDSNYGPYSFFDMYLMSQCKHNILANSSFSWWGAWLNKNKYKLVISPKQWFTEEGLKTRNPCDLYPDHAVVL